MIIEIDKGYMVRAFSNASFKVHAAKLYKNLVFTQKYGWREIPATPANLMKELRKGREVHLFPPNSKSLNPMFVFKLVEQPKLL